MRRRSPFQTENVGHLIAAFTPSVKTSLDKTQATESYADIATSYNRLPLAFEKVDPDLTSYVVGEGGRCLVRSNRQRGSQHPREPAGQNYGHPQEGLWSWVGTRRFSSSNQLKMTLTCVAGRSSAPAFTITKLSPSGEMS